MTPSGPGWLRPRGITMKLVWLPRTNSGSSGCKGMMTVPPPLVTRSRPWSKNWPKNANIRLNGADRPKSGVMFGMNSAPEAGSLTVNSGSFGWAGSAAGSEQTNPPEPQGCLATATAAGLASD